MSTLRPPAPPPGAALRLYYLLQSPLPLTTTLTYDCDIHMHIILGEYWNTLPHLSPSLQCRRRRLLSALREEQGGWGAMPKGGGRGRWPAPCQSLRPSILAGRPTPCPCVVGRAALVSARTPRTLPSPPPRRRPLPPTSPPSARCRPTWSAAAPRPPHRRSAWLRGPAGSRHQWSCSWSRAAAPHRAAP